MRCVDCGAFILQGQVVCFIGRNIHLPLCRECTQEEQGGTPLPQPSLTTLYPGMFVGQFSDEQLLEFLDYGYKSGSEIHSELCGPDEYDALWEIRRYAGTLILRTFAYRKDGTKSPRRNGCQDSIRQFQARLVQKHIRRDQLRWFPWYSSDRYDVNGLAPLFMAEGMLTPWGEAQSIIQLTNGVYWVTTSSHGGFMLTVHRAAQLLSVEALSIGELFGHWLCYEEDCAWAIIIFEKQEWGDIFPFTQSDPLSLATSIIRQVYPQYIQTVEKR